MSETTTETVVAEQAVAGETSAAGEKEATVPDDSTAVLLGAHHDILAFANTDPTRDVINGVHYNAAKGCVEATDGRILIRVPVSKHVDEFPPVKGGGSTAEDCIIPSAAYKKAIANAKAARSNGSKALPVLGYAKLSTERERVKGGGDVTRATLITTDLDTEQGVGCRCVEGCYPNLDVVVPREEPTLQIALSARLLKRIAEYAEKHGKEGSGITFAFTDSLSGVRFSFPLDDAMGECPKAEGVLMPMRLA